jgi:hypothetical protein
VRELSTVQEYALAFLIAFAIGWLLSNISMGK